MAVQSSVGSFNQALTALSQSVTELRGEAQTLQVTQTETTVSITPNKLHVWGSVSSLNITLAVGTAGIMNEYMMQFTVSGNAFSLTLPAGVRWLEEPDFVDGSTYQVSIVNNLAISAAWES